MTKRIVPALAMAVGLMAAADPVLAESPRAVCGDGWVMVMPTGKKSFRAGVWVTLPMKDILRLHHWSGYGRYEITVKPVPGQGEGYRIGDLDHASYTTILNCLLGSE